MSPERGPTGAGGANPRAEIRLPRSARRGAASSLTGSTTSSKRRSAAEITRILKREIVGRWGSRSVHHVTRRDVIELVSEIVDRGAPVAANKTLQMAKTFFTWCAGRAIIDRSPCEGVKQPTREVPRDRVLSDD